MFLNFTKKITTLVVAISFIFLFQHSASCTEVMDGMRETMDEILDVLQNSDSKREKREKLEKIVNKKFDYVEMAKRALAKNWNVRSIEERQEFTKIFSELLRNTYLNKIERYTDEAVDFVKESVSPKGVAIVKTLIIRKGDEIAVDYRLIKKRGNWFCYDFVIENISLIRNYRAQFGKIIKDSSYEDLLKRMKEKIEKLKEEEEEHNVAQNKKSTSAYKSSIKKDIFSG